MTGQRFGRLIAIERAENDKSGKACWKCICDCGNEKIVRGSYLQRGHTKSCGCNSNNSLKDLTGQRFGKLTVIERAENDKSGKACWKSICDCGKETTVLSSNLKKGHTKSCGCLNDAIDLTGERFGMLTVIERAKNNKNDKYKTVRWICKCDCGNETIAYSQHLRSGRKKDCGCISKKYGVATFKSVLNNYKKDKRRGYEFLLTDEKFKELIFSNCYYCGKKPSQIMRSIYSNGDTIYNGIDRIDNSKGYILGNVRSCCKQCNFIKSKYSEREFLSMVKAIYENLNLKSRVFPRP